MSPEQLRSRPLDARSDLFSFGLVMYESVIGRPAFSGESSAVIAAAILREPPLAPRQLRSDVPARLEQIILETIEKEPSERRPPPLCAPSFAGSVAGNSRSLVISRTAPRRTRRRP